MRTSSVAHTSAVYNNMASRAKKGSLREQRRTSKLPRQLQDLQLDTLQERDPNIPESNGSTSDLVTQLSDDNELSVIEQVLETGPLSRVSSVSPLSGLLANAHQIDILAVIAALEAARYTMPREQRYLESSASPSPTYTPPDKMNYEDGVYIVTRPKAPDPNMMRITFDNHPDFVLTRGEILRGGPKNSFLLLSNKANQVDNAQLLTISFRNKRSPHLFKIIHAFLQAKGVIPFSQEHEEMILQHYSSLDEGYEQLYQEANQFAIYALSDKVRDHQTHRSSEHFRVYDAVTHCPLREGDLERLARRIVKRPSHNITMPRVIVIGASINFTLRFAEHRSALLEYSLVAPTSSLALALAKLNNCLTATLPQQFVVESSLTEEEAERVRLDVFTFDARSKRTDDEKAIKQMHCTLKTLLLRLHPAHDPTVIPRPLEDTFVEFPFSPEDQKADDAEEKAHRSSPALRKSTTQNLLNYYLNIPYAKVSLTFAPAISIPSHPDVTLEVIQTATREVLVSQLPAELCQLSQ